MEIDYTILYLTLVFVAFIGLFFIGFNISSSIEIQGNYIIFWIMYIVTIVSIFTIGFSIYFHYVIERKRGPPGDQGQQGDTGDEGNKGKCSEDCETGLCYKIIMKTIAEKLKTISRKDVRINNIYIKNKIKEMCESDEFKALNKYKKIEDIINKLKEVWEDWVEKLYNSGSHLYFENMGAHHEFDWSNDNPWDEIMKSDYYYMGLNNPISQDDNSAERLRIIPDNDSDYCVEAFQNSANPNPNLEMGGYTYQQEKNIFVKESNKYQVIFPYNISNMEKKKEIYVDPTIYKYRYDEKDLKNSNIIKPREQYLDDYNPQIHDDNYEFNHNYYQKKKDDLKYSIYPNFILLSDEGLLKSEDSPNKLYYELTGEGDNKYTNYNLYNLVDKHTEKKLYLVNRKIELDSQSGITKPVARFKIIFDGQFPNQNQLTTSSSLSNKLKACLQLENNEDLYLNQLICPGDTKYCLSENKHFFIVDKKEIKNKKINVHLYTTRWNRGSDKFIVRDKKNKKSKFIPIQSEEIFDNKILKSINIRAANNKVSLMYKNDDDDYEVAEYVNKPIEQNKMEYTLIFEPINFDFTEIKQMKNLRDIDYSKLAIKIEEFF